MADLTAPDSTSVGITRFGRAATTSAAELGPLADLIGTWVGSEGWELIAVPEGEKSFRVILRPYTEVVTFEAIGAPVPNRGGAAPDLFIAGLLYQMRIADKETDEPLHLENGMWLNLGESQEKPIVRQASIPHGDVFLALGTSYATDGPPEIPSFDALPDPGPDIEGYTEGKYPPSDENFSPGDPNKVLREAIEGREIVNTTTLSVATEDGGGIVNIPFVEQHAKTSQFACTYWLETIKDPKTGDEVQQLQYSQQTNVEFIPKFGEPGLIMWPHVNVNTLRKQ